MVAPTASPPRQRTRDRLAERASDRARTLHSMRGTLLAVVGVVVVGYIAFSLVWLILFALGIQAATVIGVISMILNIVVNVIVLFLAWLTMEMVGRIERETDRVQQFMDNVYRRIE